MFPCAKTAAYSALLCDFLYILYGNAYLIRNSIIMQKVPQKILFASGEYGIIWVLVLSNVESIK